MKHYAKMIVLSFVLMFALIGSGARANEIQPVASNIISGCSIALTASGSSLKATAKINTYSACEKLGFSSISIQEKNSSGNWVTVKSATSKYDTNAKTYSYGLTHTGSSGKTYRAIATAMAKSDTTEYRYPTSTNVKIP